MRLIEQIKGIALDLHNAAYVTCAEHLPKLVRKTISEKHAEKISGRISLVLGAAAVFTAMACVLCVSSAIVIALATSSMGLALSGACYLGAAALFGTVGTGMLKAADARPRNGSAAKDAGLFSPEKTRGLMPETSTFDINATSKQDFTAAAEVEPEIEAKPAPAPQLKPVLQPRPNR